MYPYYYFRIAVALFVPCLCFRAANGQSLLYVSNLSQPSATDVPVGSDSWYAVSFTTGNYSLGYSLNGIQLLMHGITGNPFGFGVSIYRADGGFPGNSIVGNLTGSDPVLNRTYTYTASDITLSPSTRYFVVAHSSTPVTTGSFLWSSPSTSFSETLGGWAYGPYHSKSSDGAIWSRAAPDLQFALYATAIPEPSSLALLGIGGSFLFMRLARKSRSKALRQP